MSVLYDNYLREHIDAVNSAYRWLCDNDCISNDIKMTCPTFFTSHDESKYSSFEYDPYDRYFYGNDRSAKVVNDFNRAWLHHIHNNPHHWQHWVLMEDDPKTGENYICIEMPAFYVVEMISDWWSFSFRAGNLREIFDWYEKHKKTMKLHKNTRKLVEDILSKIAKKLDEENDI